jgi:hypothetical protein
MVVGDDHPDHVAPPERVSFEPEGGAAEPEE